MPVPSVSGLKERYQVTEVSDTHLGTCISKALLTIKDKIGFDAYGEIFGSDPSTLEDSDRDADSTNANETAHRTAKVTEAAYCLAMSKVLEVANTRMRRSGSVSKEQDSGSVTGNKTITNEYLSPKEVLEWKASLESEANGYLASYILTPEPASARRMFRG